MSALSLPPGEAHLWYVRTDAVSEPDHIASLHDLMNPEEKARHDRYVFDKNRHEFLLTRAIVRTTLSHYADIAPRDWTFNQNAYGCPAVEGPSTETQLRFNLTNTDGLVACIVSRGRDVGVDVEALDRRGETVSIADRFFSPSEVAALLALPIDAQRHRFFEYWTLKEAYIKARGMGLSIPLDQFSFQLEQVPIGITFDPRLVDNPAAWQFAQWRPTQRHLVATAVRSDDGSPIHLTIRETDLRP